MKSKLIELLKEEIGYKEKNLDCCARCKHVLRSSAETGMDREDDIYHCKFAMNILVYANGVCKHFKGLR